LPQRTIDLIKEMAVSNVTWGAERIRGELLKLGIRVCKRTIQKYVRQVRPPGNGGRTWETFVRNHADDIWACDFLQLYDVWFGPIFAFFVGKHGCREVVPIPPKSPNLTPICERLLGSVRRECLDHVLILGEDHLRRVLREYVHEYFNVARPHQGLGQQIPGAGGMPPREPDPDGRIVAKPVLGGLHHDYRRAA